MQIRASIVFIVCESIFSLVGATFYIEKKERRGCNALYECNRDSGESTNIKCRSVKSYLTKMKIYDTANFFIVADAKAKEGHSFFFNNQPLNPLPKHFMVGYLTIDPEDPGLEDLTPLLDYSMRRVNALDDRTIPKDLYYDQGVAIYLSITNVYALMTDQTIQAASKVNAENVRRLVRLYNDEVRRSVRMKMKGLYPGNNKEQMELTKKILQRAMHIILRKMIDPCAADWQIGGVQKSDADAACLSYCTFFPVAADVLGLGTCSWVLTGSCSESKRACVCTRRRVPMLGIKLSGVTLSSCDNSLRLQLDDMNKKHRFDQTGALIG